jgi:hypothetical protein
VKAGADINLKDKFKKSAMDVVRDSHIWGVSPTGELPPDVSTSSSQVRILNPNPKSY